MSDSGVKIREATGADAGALGLLCRRGFVKSPEWRVPMFVVRQWWVRVIEHPGCFVRVVESGSEPGSESGRGTVIGFYIGVRDPAVWKALGRRGPHTKWMKMLVLLTRPSFLKSYLRKRKRASGTTRGEKAGGDPNKTISNSSKSVKYQRVSVPEVVDEGGGLYLAIMAIDPEARGYGAGKLIVEHFDGLGADLGVGTLWLHVDPRNVRAQGLYSKFGYQIRGRDGTSLLMSKDCQAA